MDALMLLEQVAGKLAPGRSPSFDKVHLLKALEVINEEGVGRKQLATRLDLGEGMTRNLVSRLREHNLLETSRQGMTLTGKGKDILNEMAQMIRSHSFPSSELTVASQNYIVLVKGRGDFVKYGVEQRDDALLAGAAGATTILCTEGGLHIPGTEQEIVSHLREFILEELNPQNGDVMIIGSAGSPHMAERGAKAAALKLLSRPLPSQGPGPLG